MHKISDKNNFDHVRLFLALGVFLHHTFILTQLQPFAVFKTLVNPNVAVHSFFIVSGFLIFMSYEHSSSVKSYFTKRFKRIAPGYIAVILLSFVFLSLFSTLAFFDYFTSIESFKYLLANLSTFNFLHLTLPGVFSEHINTSVNGALWTIKVEVMFYISVPFIVYTYRWFGATKTLSIIFLLSALYFYSMVSLSQEFKTPFFAILVHQLPGQMMFFSAGALLYYHHEKFLKQKHFIFLLAIIGFISEKYLSFYPLYAISLSIIVIYLATGIVYLGHIARYGDLSYGIYIWHFPLIQTFIALHFFEESPIRAFMVLTLLILCVSWLSWHIIEKPFLSKKSHYSKENP